MQKLWATLRCKFAPSASSHAGSRDATRIGAGTMTPARAFAVRANAATFARATCAATSSAMRIIHSCQTDLCFHPVRTELVAGRRTAAAWAWESRGLPVKSQTPLLSGLSAQRRPSAAGIPSSSGGPSMSRACAPGCYVDGSIPASIGLVVEQRQKATNVAVPSLSPTSTARGLGADSEPVVHTAVMCRALPHEHPRN